ncbi:MAG: hypothetical protein ACJ8IK_23340 [Burkholderiaceae bacterium]|jgi:hypothetical protein
MPHPLSTLGIAHTAISLVPLVAGMASFARHRRIDPASTSGRVYLAGLVASVLTSFGLSSTGGFNPGHALGILALLAVGGALLAPRLALLGRAGDYLATLGLSFSFFLLLVPGTNETLSRLPPSQPIANGPQSPIVQGTLAVLFVLFLLGYVQQALAIRARRRLEQA